MKAPKPITQLPSAVTTVGPDGKETHHIGDMHLLPPAADKCQVCATKHEPQLPHNAQSLYYQTVFQSMIGRSPTWADAAAHCAPEMRKAWKDEFARQGHEWTEPPDGEQPIEHHGVA